MTWPQDPRCGLRSAEGNDHLAYPAGYALSNAAQNAIALLDHKGTKLDQVGVH